MSDNSYKGSKSTKSGKQHTTDSHYEQKGNMPQGSERGGIKGSKKGIKHSFAGRNLHETEHHSRMGHTNEMEMGGFSNGDGATQM